MLSWYATSCKGSRIGEELRMIKAVVLIVVLAGIFVMLYQSGILVLQSKSAVFFVGSARGTGARFTGCSGYIKRIVRFPEAGTYTYLLDAQLSKGDMSVELLDAGKQKLMELSCARRSASVTVEKKKKYCLVIRFRSATGRYSLIRE